ncbi:hypothetical protein G7Z17_g6069 [Cylindrodendrum hubeiense]|uniref:ATPase AAA-type core domain-containing protein n=1 Tax=Cylindrodendrum hubeiense TaxID=595255 RepID=A0A9P5L8K4_9HYPO|nr:hypothetical protein G7Z17_g6069 [Cylindrodendrum hubeiense]
MDDETASALSTPPSLGVEVGEDPEMVGESQPEVVQSDPERKRDTDNEKDAEILLDSAIKDDETEVWSSVERKAQRSQYDILGKRILDTEKANGNLKLRSKQAILHFTFTEMRLTELEEELQDLKQKIFDLPKKEQEKFPVCKPILKRSGADEFRITLKSKDIPITERPSLEVLYTSIVPKYGGLNADQPFTLTRRATGSLEMEELEFVAGNTPDRLRIRSWTLNHHLQKTCRETFPSPTTTIERSDSIPSLVILRPFKPLVIYEQAIRESETEIKNLVEEAEKSEEKGKGIGTFNDVSFEYKDLLRDLRLLIEFLDKDLKPTLDLRKSLRDGSATEIEYADLWHLFELGDIAVARSNKEQAFKVVNFTGGRHPLINKMSDEDSRAPPVDGFTVDCCSIQFDGTHYVPKLHKLSIAKFTGPRPISSLEISPLKFHPNSKALHEEFLSQGRQYLDITSSPFCHKMLRGRTLDEPPQDLEAQIIVDMVMAVKTEPEWRPTQRIAEEDLTKSDLRETKMQSHCNHNLDEGCCGSDIVFKDQEMNCIENAPFRRDYGGLFVPRPADELKEDIVLLPIWVHGFVLRLRQWVTVKVSDLVEVSFENDFSKLMISENHKQTVLALVQTHENVKTIGPSKSQSLGASLDLVKGKGTGLILLLHGEPDVFLAKRNKTDLRRNAVTSVFLRSLEYYAGILFLTTNRVGGIDPAFKSRIHLSVYYPRLDLDTTLKLYENLLIKTKEEQKKSGAAHFSIKSKEILGFAKRHYRGLQKEGYNTWNGRQIRNAFQTSIALVENQVAQLGPDQPKPVLGKEQFKVVAQGSKEFDSYLMRTLQGADDEIAIRDQWRDDRFDAEAAFNTLSASKPGQKSSRAAIPRGKAPKSEESPSETESLSESESESDTEDEDEDDGKTKTTGEKADAPAAKADLDDYEEFLKFKAMLKARGK